MTVLVTGATGYLGSAVARLADAVPAARVDVADRAAILALFASVRPKAVIHCAAVLGNKRAGGERNWAVNALGAGHVAAAALAVGARLVHVSSDAVHSGRPSPYTDDDPPSPVYEYGAVKAAAEAAVQTVHPAAVLVRTSLIVSGGRAPLSNHEETALALATGAAEGVLFTDEIRCPVPVEDLAAALVELTGNDYAGVLNVAGPRPMSRHEFGVLVARRHGIDPARVPAGSIAASGLRRPGDVKLDSTRAGALLRVRIADP